MGETTQVLRIFLLFIFLSMSLSCSVNVLTSFADKNTNAAIYEDAKKQINGKDYGGAITTLAKLTGAFAADRKVIALKASAYAGLCGFEFIPFALALKNITGTRLFPFLINYFRSGSGTKIDNCTTAQDLIESIGAVGLRTDDENMFLAVISFAKIGAVSDGSRTIASRRKDQGRRGREPSLARRRTCSFLSSAHAVIAPSVRFISCLINERTANSAEPNAVKYFSASSERS